MSKLVVIHALWRHIRKTVQKNSIENSNSQKIYY